MKKHNPEQCRRILESLSDFVDGTLNPDLCSELERHLEGCQDCQIVVDTLKKTIYLYHNSSNTPPVVPQDVRQRLYKRLDLMDFLEK